MENFLIVIVLIGSIIYKIYSNYKKEMENAKKRNPKQKPVIFSEPIDYPIEKVKTKAQKFLKTNEIVKEIASKTKYQEEIIPDEVRIVTEYRQQTNKKNISLPIEEENIETEKISFDLRQAVIQAAILERPYK